MSLRCTTPCDYGDCPYDACYNRDCEAWCGEYEPQDDPEIWEDEEEIGYNDFTIRFHDGEGTHAESSFLDIATDFEVDYFLKKAIPAGVYEWFVKGSLVLTGIGEDGYLESCERHKPIMDFTHGEHGIVFEIGVKEAWRS